MTPGLLLPAALAALAALAIPLLIHIARRTENRTVDFAALRWLNPRDKPRRRPRLDERLLLAARLLLLAFLAVWLARPVIWELADDRPVVAIAPGVNVAAAGAAEGARMIWLAPDFPPIDGAAPRPQAGLMSLIRQLDSELPPATPLEIVLPPTLNGVDAERPRLTRRVVWRVAPAPVRPAASEPSLPPDLAVRHASGSVEAVRYFRAAASAWTEPGLRPAFEAETEDRPIGRETRHLIWLAPGTLPDAVVAWVRGGGVVLMSSDTRAPGMEPNTPVWRDPSGEPLANAAILGSGRVLRFTRPLQPSTIPQLVEPDFPDALLRMLAPPPPPARVRAVDHAPTTGVAPYDQPPFDLRPWLALFISLTFLGERWLATRHNRAAAP